jgi:hypothetical protein
MRLHAVPYDPIHEVAAMKRTLAAFVLALVGILIHEAIMSYQDCTNRGGTYARPFFTWHYECFKK